MTKVLLLIGVGLLVMGCNAQIQDYVRNGDEDSILPPFIPPPLLDMRYLKLSPGSVTSVGTTTGMRATLTPTNQTMQGSDVTAILSISQSHID